MLGDEIGECIIRNLLLVQNRGGFTQDPTQVVKEEVKVCSLNDDLGCGWFGSGHLLPFVYLDLLDVL